MPELFGTFQDVARNSSSYADKEKKIETASFPSCSFCSPVAAESCDIWQMTAVNPFPAPLNGGGGRGDRGKPRRRRRRDS